MEDILSDREISEIDEKKLKIIERYNSSYERRESAEAKKEFCKQLRYIFEKAPSETIPFLVYCIYVAALGLFSILYLLIKFEGLFLYIGLGVVLIAMFLPLVSLPKLKMGILFSFFKKYKKSKTEKMTETKNVI